MSGGLFSCKEICNLTHHLQGKWSQRKQRARDSGPHLGQHCLDAPNSGPLLKSKLMSGPQMMYVKKVKGPNDGFEGSMDTSVSFPSVATVNESLFPVFFFLTIN